MEDKLLINGPMNAVRLEGEVFGIKKSVLVFFDFHLDVSVQTQCADYESIDIEKYLYEIIKKSPKPIDLFFEYQKTMILHNQNNNHTSTQKDKYIRQTNKLLSGKYVKFTDKPTSTHKYHNQNARLHYLDIRDMIGYDFHNIVADIQYSLDETLNRGEFTKEILDMLLNKTEQLLHLLNSEIDPFTENTDMSELTSPILNKLKYKYNRKSVFDKFTENIDYIRNIKKKLVSKLQTILVSINKNYKHLTTQSDQLDMRAQNEFDIMSYGVSYFIFNDYIHELRINFALIDRMQLILFAQLTDLFFLRRFLDKDYITTAITYTGALHSVNYIHYLITKYNFKITHFSYASITDLPLLNQTIANIKKVNEFIKLEQIFYPPTLIQCSNLSSFPKLL